MRRPHRGHEEEGQATLILLFCLVLAITIISMVIVRIGHADVLRTKAQNAADASALAAAAKIRDRAIVGMTSTPNVAVQDLSANASSEAAAKEYAHDNKAVLTNYQSSPFTSEVTTTVRTQECIDTSKPKGSNTAEKPCIRTDTSKSDSVKNRRSATAVSVATVDMPACSQVFRHDSQGRTYTGLSCVVDGLHKFVSDLSWNQLLQLFKVHLINHFDNSLDSTLGGGVSQLGHPTGAHRAQNEKIAQQMAASQGWSGAQWQCLDQMWIHESNFDEQVKNAGSGAAGIPQALPASKMGATANSNSWPANAKAQIAWGLNYIKGRYGDPCSAWAWWQRTDPRPSPGHWY